MAVSVDVVLFDLDDTLFAHRFAVEAAAAGLTGVWLDRPGTATSDELAEADASGVHVLRRLAELPSLLA